MADFHRLQSTSWTSPFPGKSVLAGDSRKHLVRHIQARLNDTGCGPIEIDGEFGTCTRIAVMRFQVSRGFVPDGAVGPKTWGGLFPEPLPPPPSRRFADDLLQIAAREVGVRESGGPNRGPRVDEYLRNVGLDPARGSFPWCASFVYFCFTKTAVALSRNNPCVKTAGCMDHWNRAPAWSKLDAADMQADASAIRPGAVFIVDHGKGRGHTGLVERVDRGSIHTIEGNTNEGGSREGDGVYRKVRLLSAIKPGFIDYGLEPLSGVFPN